MKSPSIKSFKIRKLHLRNFKAFDDIDIYFPEPRMEDDPDVIVMGSENGLGKTSVLEACSLLFFALFSRGEEFGRHFHGMPIDLYDVLIRAGKQTAEIAGKIEYLNRSHEVSLTLMREGQAMVAGNDEFNEIGNDISHFASYEAAKKLLYSLAGLISDPLIFRHLMYFHSYRKVQEGNPELGMMVSVGRRVFHGESPPRYDLPSSAFKLEILLSMMSQAGLFEKNETENVEATLEQLNSLTERYAGGRIGKLRPSQDNTIELRVAPVKDGESFPFDGLSSGQKEIISTLFLIWHHTHNSPGIVLIDEPELHLNPEWQLDFIRQLHKLVPDNQYIIATHSESIFFSVDKDRRKLLVAKEESK
jgi:predicted ATPase